MRTIAIILGDNDFGSTFLNLLETVERMFEWHEDETLNEENVAFAIRALAMPHYVAFQYRFNPACYGRQDLTVEEHLADISKYFNDLRILFDEEAEHDIATGDHDGGAWYLEIQSGTITGY